MARDRPLSILHVLAPDRVGGIESVVALLSAGQRERGHRVHVAAVLDEVDTEHPFVTALDAAGVDTTRVVAPSRAYLHEYRAILETCRRILPDLVHTHGYRADVIASRAARRAGCSTFTTVHGFSGGSWKNRLYESMQRRSYRSMSAVIAVARAQLGLLRRSGVAESALHLLPNAFVPRGRRLDRGAARAGLGLPRDGTVIGFVGRLSREKGADLLLEAVAKMRDRESRVAVLGEGGEGEVLREQARALGLARRVHWLGLVPEAWRFFAAFDTLALSSRTEGTPIVLFEAMDSQVPIVAHAVGGVPDVAGEGCALLVDPLDPGALARGLDAALRDRATSVARAGAARERLLDRYAVGPWLDRHERIYVAS